MEAVDEVAFLSWSASRGVTPDGRYNPPRCLVFQHDRSESRFWERPPRPGDSRAFFGHLLAGLEPWRVCYLWPRGGRWSNPHPARNRLEEDRDLGLYGVSVRDGFRGALACRAGQAEHLLDLIEDRSRSALCVYDDLFVLPDHATQILYWDHHEVVHVECADAAEMERFVLHMSRGGYALPEALPDETFKRPGWMK